MKISVEAGVCALPELIITLKEQGHLTFTESSVSIEVAVYPNSTALHKALAHVPLDIRTRVIDSLIYAYYGKDIGPLWNTFQTNNDVKADT